METIKEHVNLKLKHDRVKYRIYNIINSISGRTNASNISLNELIDEYGDWVYCGGFECGERNYNGIKIHNVIAHRMHKKG